MKKAIFRAIAKGIGKNNTYKVVDFLLHYNGLSFTDYFRYKVKAKQLDSSSVLGQVYRLLGIDEMHGGEEYFISQVLPKIIRTKQPVFFDVGANIGKYSISLHERFPESVIYCFEPNPNTFDLLQKNVSHFATTINKGLSHQSSEAELFMENQNDTSSWASMYKDVFTDLYPSEDVMKVSIELDTLDNFCSDKISVINFLKIDTEGHELNVMKGAKNLINQNRVEIIQLEFNEMNIVSKVFLKDFYDLLSHKFNFYRLLKDGMVALGNYTSLNEIFRYQDLILIKKEIPQEFS